MEADIAADMFKTIPSFADMDSDSLQAIASAAVKRVCAKGEAVFLDGSPCAGLHFVQEGWLKASIVSPNGREQIIRFVGPGEAFNEISTLTGGSNRATVEALEPVKMWVISPDSLSGLLAERPGISQMIIRGLAERVRHLMNLVEDLSLRSVVARLARLLLEHSATRDGTRHDWSTQREMAARLGTVPDVLSRALRSLAEEDLIQLDRRNLIILDRDGLEAKAEDFD